nr:hypothetical protein CFP56_21309 [Quercus suber]
MATFNHATTKKVGSSKSGLKPQYYLARSSTTATPLIPLDELPEYVALHNVSRTLRPDEVEDMSCVGFLPHPNRFFELDNKSPKTFGTRHLNHINLLQTAMPQAPTASQLISTDRQFVAPDFLARRTLTQQTASQKDAMVRVQDRTSWRNDNEYDVTRAHDIQAKIDLLVAANPGKSCRTTSPVAVQTLPPSGIIPNQEKKRYCTHWIRTATCDYIQQGCMFKHELPPTEIEFEQLGLRPEMCRWMLGKEVKGQFEVPDYLRRMLRPKSVARVVAGGTASIRLPTSDEWMQRIESGQESESEASDGTQEQDVETDAVRKVEATPKGRRLSVVKQSCDLPRRPRGHVTRTQATAINSQASLIAGTYGDLIDLGPEISSTPVSYSSGETSGQSTSPPTSSAPAPSIPSIKSESHGQARRVVPGEVQPMALSTTTPSRSRPRRARNAHAHHDRMSSPPSAPRDPVPSGTPVTRIRVPAQHRGQSSVAEDSVANIPSGPRGLAASMHAPRGPADRRPRRTFPSARTRPNTQSNPRQ